MASFIRPFALGTSELFTVSGMEPFKAGLNRVDCSPIVPSMPKMKYQFMVIRPYAPMHMARSSSPLAHNTMDDLGKRSASHPAQAEKSTKGSAKIIPA